MPRNVEIKARVDDAAALRVRVAAIATSGPVELAQDDAFFRCETGRLKLRACSKDKGELIFYRRADAAGPKESSYVISPTADPEGLREALTAAYGGAGRVRKRRTLYQVGRARVHLDDVEGLGHFLELEVVLQDGEPAEAGVREAESLLRQLAVDPSRLVERAYVDLIQG